MMGAQAEYFPLQPTPLAGLVWGPSHAEPVLALHGWLDNASSFCRLAQGLSGVRLIAPDLPGHGYSSHRPAAASYAVWDYLPDLQRLLDHLGLARVHLLGHSLGAGIASLFAAVYPERVASVALLDGLGPVTTAEADVVQQMRRALRRREPPLHLGFETLEQAVLARMSGRFPVDEEVARELVQRALSKRDGRWYWHTDPRLTRPSVLRLTQGQVDAFLRAIKAPVCLFRANRGVELTSEQALSCITHLEVFDVDGNHHFHTCQHGVKALIDPLQTLWRNHPCDPMQNS